MSRRGYIREIKDSEVSMDRLLKEATSRGSVYTGKTTRDPDRRADEHEHRGDSEVMYLIGWESDRDVAWLRTAQRCDDRFRSTQPRQVSNPMTSSGAPSLRTRSSQSQRRTQRLAPSGCFHLACRGVPVFVAGPA